MCSLTKSMPIFRGRLFFFSFQKFLIFLHLGYHPQHISLLDIYPLVNKQLFYSGVEAVDISLQNT